MRARLRLPGDPYPYSLLLRRFVLEHQEDESRALKTAADERGRVRAGASETSLFIYPPYEFKVVDHLLTNFHLPRSTLLMLVCAFGGYEAVMAAYREAVKEGYRFYSYGDAMAVIQAPTGRRADLPRPAP